MSDRYLEHKKTLRRLAAIETVLTDLLSENTHQFVGGESFAKDSIQRLAEAAGKVPRVMAPPFPPRVCECGHGRETHRGAQHADPCTLCACEDFTEAVPAPSASPAPLTAETASGMDVISRADAVSALMDLPVGLYAVGEAYVLRVLAIRAIERLHSENAALRAQLARQQEKPE